MGTERPNVWVLMPTAGAAHTQAAIDLWRSRGYFVANQIDPGRWMPASDFVVQRPYRGVWEACNYLAKAVTERAREFAVELADVCLFAGDDMEPDPRFRAEEIGAQFLARFPDGFGVMQPCGDPQGGESWASYSTRVPQDAAALLKSGFREGAEVPAAARICGSAWFGRGWVQRAFGGAGPTPGEYHHFYADEELAAVATKLGVLWWRPDLAQKHNHWSWGHMQRQPYHEKNQEYWTADQNLFFLRKANGWPGHEPANLVPGGVWA